MTIGKTDAPSPTPLPFQARQTHPQRGRDPYPLFATAVMAWATLVVLRHDWSGDFRIHSATVHALLLDPWRPVDPLLGSHQGSPYDSPYMVLLAQAAACTHVSARTALEAGGLASLALWLWSLRRLCRRISPRPVVPVLAAAFTFTLWGLEPLAWSGFFGLGSLSYVLPYPCTAAAALMMLTWDAFLAFRGRSHSHIALAVTLAGLLALVFLVHPFTGVNTVIGLTAFALADPSAVRRARPILLVASAAAACALVALWPLSDVPALFSGSSDFNAVHKELVDDITRHHGLAAYGLASVGLPALVARARTQRPMGRELLTLLTLSAFCVAVGAVTGWYSLARAIPAAVLPLHLSLAAHLAEGPAGRRAPTRPLYGVVVGSACLAGLIAAQSVGVARAAWWTPARIPAYARLLASLTPGQVLISDDTTAGMFANERGAYSVVPAWPDPGSNTARRVQDTSDFFARDTSASQRLSIADRYAVNCVSVALQRAVLSPGALPGFHPVAQSPDGELHLLCRG